jgi:hypothetical protein
MDSFTSIKSKIKSLELLIRDNINDDTVEMLVLLSQLKEEITSLFIETDDSIIDKSIEKPDSLTTSFTELDSPSNMVMNTGRPVFKESTKLFYNKNNLKLPPNRDVSSPDLDGPLFARSNSPFINSKKSDIDKRIDKLSGMLEKNNIKTPLLSDIRIIVHSHIVKTLKEQSNDLNIIER